MSALPLERPLALPREEWYCGVMTFPELDRITFDPAVMGGKPCIRGMRVTVGTLLGLIASGAKQDEILRLYPYLEAADISAALAYGRGSLPLDKSGAGE